ncbi:MAG: serine/threonine-protein kinase [Myxococcota bacterium]|nr:serine/threonine-protein kinase [Myxococcota bacterium]
MSVGEKINDRYALEEILGEGGFGAVYRGRDLVLSRPVAVKRLHPEVSADSEQQKRFLAEAQLTSQLRDPHTITVFDHGVDQTGQLFLVTELLEGESLEERLERGPLSSSEVFQYFIPLCEALQEAHDLGILHRDLKPANLFISERRGIKRIKLLDFGIAKALESLPGTKSEHFKLTTTGNFVGSPYYLSPEQALGEKNLSAATDLYSLGVTLYESLSCETPFKGESLLQLLTQIAYQAPKPIGELTGTPWRLAFTPLLNQLLAKKAEERLGEAMALRAALVELSQRDDLNEDERPPALAPSVRSDQFKVDAMVEMRSDEQVSPLGFDDTLNQQYPHSEDFHRSVTTKTLPLSRQRTLFAWGVIASVALIAVALFIFDRSSTEETEDQANARSGPALPQLRSKSVSSAEQVKAREEISTVPATEETKDSTGEGETTAAPPPPLEENMERAKISQRRARHARRRAERQRERQRRARRAAALPPPPPPPPAEPYRFYLSPKKTSFSPGDTFRVVLRREGRRFVPDPLGRRCPKQLIELGSGRFKVADRAQGKVNVRFCREGQCERFSLSFVDLDAF